MPAFLISVLLAFVPTLLTACSRPSTPRPAIEPIYDQQTGKLQLLKYDSNGNGKIDTWSYMDGARVVRIEIDSDEDGKIDRWEYYGPHQTLEKIGSSRANDGHEDAWSYIGWDGAITRIELSTRHDGKVTRVEHYANHLLVRAEEDTDEDGKVDKWETFENGRLTSVAYDSTRRGTPDRRLLYGADGPARLEVDAAGNGRFVPVSTTTSEQPKSSANRTLAQ